MLSSGPYRFKLKGLDAQMHVCRNDGFCWGRVVIPDGREYDVDTRRDWYEQDDEAAAEAFIRKARLPGALQEPAGWRGFAWIKEEQK